MTTERYIRIIAGTFVLASLALGTFANHNWYCFGICWRKPVSIRLLEMAPDGRHSAESWSEKSRTRTL
jgi:hypothetical protein